MYSLDEIRAYRSQYGKRNLLLDTNLFLLLLVGLCDKHTIHTCSATKKYCHKDYETLCEILKYFKPEVVLTPHILAEISNLSRKSKNISDKKQAYYFNLLVERFKLYKEESVSLADLLNVKVDIIIKFGFADIGILEVARKHDAVVMSADYGLVQYGLDQKIPCIQFETIRVQKLTA